jgi:hypothetical protein
MTLADTLVGLDLDARADFLLDVLANGNGSAVAALAEALEEMGAEGTLSQLDALAEARRPTRSMRSCSSSEPTRRGWRPDLSG